MNVETVKQFIVLEVKNLKETLYFYRRILGIKPSLERPQLDVTGFGMMLIQRELVLL